MTNHSLIFVNCLTLNNFAPVLCSIFLLQASFAEKLWDDLNTCQQEKGLFCSFLLVTFSAKDLSIFDYRFSCFDVSFDVVCGIIP
jgi:hypothetical protein